MRTEQRPNGEVSSRVGERETQRAGGLIAAVAGALGALTGSRTDNTRRTASGSVDFGFGWGCVLAAGCVDMVVALRVV